MSATSLQALLRFLSQDAKVPLAAAMGKVKDLQKASLDTPEKIAKAKIDEVKLIFEDERVAKQVLAASKRVSKKRAAGESDTGPSPAKRKKKGDASLQGSEMPPADVEAALALPTCDESEKVLEDATLFSNRAPLALAFVFTLLKHTMPKQPLSSRLSLAQGYIGVTSKARALSLGIDKGTSAEEDGFGAGQPSVMVAGKEVKVLRRWGYEWRTEEESVDNDDGGPPLWALDLEALRKSNTLEDVPAIGRATAGGSGSTNLPIHTAQAARAYLMKAFASGQSDSAKKASGAGAVAEKERNLGRLLQVLGLLYESWATVLTAEELDKRTWGWYVRVRPDVADGAAGWGGKNVIKLGNILAMRRRAAT